MNSKRLFFDIETSFNTVWSWRTGQQYINADQVIDERAIICISWKWADDPIVHSLTWDRNQSDKEMLKSFILELNKADEVIAHNGDKFDIRWLRTRCLKNGIQMFPKYQSLDTLKLVRSSFNFNSNTLNYIAKYLGLGEKLETGGINLWKEIIFNNNQESLDKMVEYCNQDVILLEKVYNHLKNYLPHKTHNGVLNNKEKFSCPECSSYNQRCNKIYSTAQGTKKYHLRCNDCGRSHTVNESNYKALMTYKESNKI